MATQQNNNQQQKPNYNYTSLGPLFYSKDNGTALKLSLRVDSDYTNSNGTSLILNIHNLTDDGKFKKLNENNYDSAFFSLNSNELTEIMYTLDQMFLLESITTSDENINKPDNYGCIISHVGNDGNGTQFEICRNDKGTVIYIDVIEGNEITNEYQYLLSNTRKISKYLYSGDIVEEVINLDIYMLKYILLSAMSVTSGLVTGLITRINSSNGGYRKPIANPQRRVGSFNGNNVPSKKPVAKPIQDIDTDDENLPSFLNESDDEED